MKIELTWLSDECGMQVGTVVVEGNSLTDCVITALDHLKIGNAEYCLEKFSEWNCSSEEEFVLSIIDNLQCGEQTEEYPTIIASIVDLDTGINYIPTMFDPEIKLTGEYGEDVDKIRKEKNFQKPQKAKDATNNSLRKKQTKTIQAKLVKLNDEYNSSRTAFVSFTEKDLEGCLVKMCKMYGVDIDDDYEYQINDYIEDISAKLADDHIMLDYIYDVDEKTFVFNN